MTRKIHRTIIYFIGVILPTIICSLIYIDYQEDKDYEIRKAHAQWIASIHETHWDQLVSETVTTLRMLSIAFDTTIHNPEQMKPLLIKAQQSDPRYSGLLILDSKGRMITGSNSSINEPDQSKKKYIQEVIKTKDIIISNNEEILNNGQKVIGIAQPLIDKKNQLEFILIAQIRVDYVINVMKVLTPESELIVTNQNDKVIMNFNVDNGEYFNDSHWLTIPIDRLPWNIKIRIMDKNDQKFIIDSISSILVITILFHIFFLIIKYYLFRRQTAKEKKQNEVQKLELVGSLAASTAHEIRNPLTGIKGLVQLLSEKYKEPSDQFYFSVIQKEIERINQIVSEFLILGKPTIQKLEIIDIREIVEEVKPLITSEANLFHVSLTFHTPDTPVIIKCSKDQMKQVILNLSKNALEAMQSGGRLTIQVEIVKKSCKISISDTGVGIPKDNLDKIFLPFYTSKESGTGLGLVVCKRIIHEFGGEISLSSKMNEGTIVEISLPLI